ncbi:MAG: hypothetical protein IJK22_11515 [Bacteroidales bacterium]|nr:hypothetical protein [Bacteroidales bacterium]
MRKTVLVPAAGEPTGILEDFVDKGAISVYFTPGTYLTHVETKAGISDAKFIAVP